VGPACQRLCHHAPCLDWLARAALLSRRALKAPSRQRRTRVRAPLPVSSPSAAFRCATGRRTPSSRRRSRCFFPVCRSPSLARAKHRRTPPFPPPRRPAVLHPPPVRSPRCHLYRTALPSPPAPVAKPRRRAIMPCGRLGYALRPPCTLGRCPGASGPRAMCRPPRRSCGRGPRGPYATGP
jgi:hypothetical protein